MIQRVRNNPDISGFFMVTQNDKKTDLLLWFLNHLRLTTVKSNFLQRAITGIIFVAVLIGCIVGGAVSFGILFAIISALAINEFCNLVNHVEGIQVNKRICILSGIFSFPVLFLFWNRSFTNRYIYSLFSFIYLSDGQRTLFEKRKPAE